MSTIIADLDAAQRISLIQRNLETAQTALDSAAELLNIVIAGIQNVPLSAAQPPIRENKLLLPATSDNEPRRRGRPPSRPVNAFHQRGSGRRISAVTETVLHLLASSPQVDKVTITKHLKEKGLLVPSATLTKTLSNLLQRGQAERVNHGVYRFLNRAS